MNTFLNHFQSKLLLGDTSGIIKGIPRPKVIPHTEPEDYLGRYSGLMLYLREMDESVYSKLCGVSTFFESSVCELNSFHVGLFFRRQ